MEKNIIIYGTAWCGDCFRVRRFFDRNQINYQWIDIDKDREGENFVITTNKGMRSVPTIVLKDNSILVEPTDKELQFMLDSVDK